MGLRIGEIPGTLLAGRIEIRSDSAMRARDNAAPAPGSARPRPDERIRAGFGENTVSIPGLAARTLGRNLTEARKLVPTVAELQQEQQMRAEERRSEALENLEARRESLQENVQEPVIRVDFQRAESQARAQARQFINSVNEAAGQARTRVEGAPAPAQGPQASIQVAGQAFTFNPPGAAQFDLRG